MATLATYGMKNVEIVEDVVCGTTKTYLVYADTERFGKHEIMAQIPTREAAEKWLKDNGVEIKQKTAMEMLEEQIKSPAGKIQIGNTMYRRIHRDGDDILGYSNTDGWTKLNRAFDGAVVIGKNLAKTTTFGYSYQRVKTIKFGNACTW